MKRLLLPLLAVFSVSAFANDWEDFHPAEVIDHGEITSTLKSQKDNAAGGVTPNAITPFWFGCRRKTVLHAVNNAFRNGFRDESIPGSARLLRV